MAQGLSRLLDLLSGAHGPGIFLRLSQFHLRYLGQSLRRYLNFHRPGPPGFKMEEGFMHGVWDFRRI